MAGMFVILAAWTVWCMTDFHRKLDEIGFLRTSSDGQLATGEERTQFAYRVPGRKVAARIIAGDEHRALDTDPTAAAVHHHRGACRCVVRRYHSEASCTMCLTTR